MNLHNNLSSEICKGEMIHASQQYPFKKMFDPFALHKARFFLEHEAMYLVDILNRSEDIKNMVVVGSGPLAYSDLALKYDIRYLGIDPHYHMQSPHSSVVLSECEFEKISRRQIGSDPAIFVFWFNVMFYLQNPFSILNRIVKKGDIVFQSTWSKHVNARLPMAAYFKAIYDDSPVSYISAMRKIQKARNIRNISHRLSGRNRFEKRSNGINSVEVVCIDSPQI